MTLNSDNARGDLTSERSRRWITHEPNETYRCDSHNSNLIMATGGLSIVAVILGCILVFMGIKNSKQSKKKSNQIVYNNERAQFLN